MPTFNYDDAEQKRFEATGSGKMPNPALGLQWDGDKPFYTRADGSKMYVSPAEGSLSQPGADPKLSTFAKSNEQPGQSFLHHRGVWDADQGDWKQDIDWNNIGSLAMGAALTGGLASAAMGPAAAGVTAGAAPATTSGIASATALGLPVTEGLGSAGLAASAAAAPAGLAASSIAPSTGSLVPATSSSLGSQGMNWGAILKGVEKGYDTYSNVSDVVGKASAGANAQNNQQDQLKLLLQQLVNSENTNAATLPSKRLATSVQGSMAAHATPTKFNWGGPGSVAHGGAMPSFSGGMSDALANLDPETKQLGQTNVHDMLLQELQGGRGGGNTDMAAPQVGQESGFDKVLGGSALATALLAALSKRKPGTSSPQVQPTPSFDFGGDYA